MIAFLLHGITAGGTTCVSSSWLQNTYTDKCHAQGVGNQPGNVADAAACCAACAAESSCETWVFCEKGSKECMKEQMGVVEGKNCKLCSVLDGKLSSIKGATSGGGNGPSPGPGPRPYPPTPTPPPGPKPAPVLGFQPHIIFNLVDDVGRYNFGWRGNKEARTPNVDYLVENGVILDRHYVFKYCSPTRSSFLSGRFPVRVNVANRGPSDAGGVHIGMTMTSDVLVSAGYVAHQVGKWHAGSSCPANLPVNRGFTSSFGYMGGAEDHYTQIGDYKGVVYGDARDDLKNYSSVDAEGENIVDIWDTSAPAYGKNGTYNCLMYNDRTLEIINKHDVSKPLFLYNAWQEAHTPNEVPDFFLGPDPSKGGINWPLRRTYEGMLHALDSALGNVTAALKAKGMWEKTIIVFSSDNGGREDGDFGGNNWPLRGMKFTSFEGGTRVAAFMSGGALPAAARGQTATALIHICDWRATFAALAGADPFDYKAAAFAGGGVLPPIDSMNQWPAIAAVAEGKNTSVRSTMILSSNAYIQWPYKIVLGTQMGKGIWTGQKSPNKTVVKDKDPGCGGGKDETHANGCLFNIETDPTEHNDLAKSMASTYASVAKAWDAEEAAVPYFQTNDTPEFTNCTTPAHYAMTHQNFGGPVCYNGTIPFF